MKIKDIMSRDVVFVTPQTKVVEVAETLFRNGFHGLPVVENGKVVGIITENDFFIKDQGTVFLPSYINFLKENRIMDELPNEKKKKIKALLNLEAKSIMTPDPVTASPESETSEVLEFIKKTRFNTMPVTDDSKYLLGVVTLVDIIGMVKQSRSGDNPFKPREIEELTKDVHSWWKDKFIFINKARVRNWKAIFIIAFIAGAIATLIWTISIKIQSKTGVGTNDNSISQSINN